MFSRIRSAVCSGMDGREICVETDIARGLPGVNIVGLASTTVMESRDRIRSAIVNSGFDFPRGRITVNLTPASLRKNGSGLDLPIALGILAAGLEADITGTGNCGIIGELSLDGDVLSVTGVLPMIICLQSKGISRIILPEKNLTEAMLVSGAEIYPVSNLRECVSAVNSLSVFDPRYSSDISDEKQLIRKYIGGTTYSSDSESLTGYGDFSDISGQENAKRAITIAAAGRHALLMTGSPGCGKSMLARRMPTIMPRLTEEEMLETAIVSSVCGKEIMHDENGRVIISRPFRNPHHTIGKAGLVGGGITPVPGEITLAHNGVLFLDEICEFKSHNIEALRLPLEEKTITHFRKGEAYRFPCDFQLVMAANPCPCGYYGDPDHICRCSEAQLEAYRRRLSGPIIDRIDMRISMEKVTFDQLSSGRSPHLSSEEMRRDVMAAIEFAKKCGRSGFNALMDEEMTEKVCRLGTKEKSFMRRAYSSLHMSPRSYKKTLKVARTIADIDQSKDISERHLAEALSYRTIEQING